jgi:hypothetical protein
MINITCEAAEPVHKKHCYISGEYKASDAFHRRSFVHDGRASECKDCRNALGRKYYADHKDKCQEKSKRYYDENKQQAQQNTRQRYHENREAERARSAAYYAKKKALKNNA